MKGAGWRVQFVVLAFAWGSAFWWIAWGLQSFSPIQETLLRNAIAGGALLLMLRLSRISLPRDPAVWRRAAVVGFLINVVPGVLTAVMQQYVSSSVTAILIATIPLGVVIATFIAYRDQRPSRVTVIGLLTGLVGILIFLGVWRQAPTGQWWAVLGLVGVVASCGIGFPYYGHHFGRSTIHPTAIVTMQLTMAAAVLVVISSVEGVVRGFPAITLTGQAVIGVLGLGLVSGALGNTLSFRILRIAGPTAMSMINYAIPIVAVLIGVLLLGEHLTWNQALGGLIVLLGIAIAQGLLRVSRRTPASTAT